MADCWLGNLASTRGRERMIEEMMEGRELANQLRSVLIGSGSSADDLVMKILKSFSNILFILMNVNDFNYEDSVSQIQAHFGPGRADPPCLDARKSQDSQERFIDGDRNKKRKTSHTRLRQTPFPIADGHAWRKYGEKKILKAKYPRTYYRCSHKYNQNCNAIKQVQRIQEDPCLYQTAYIGHHTCTNFLAAPKLAMDCTGPCEPASTIISFESSNNLTNKQELSCLSSLPSMKRESMQEESSCNMNHNDRLSISDYFMPPDPRPFDSLRPITMLSSEFNDGDMICELMQEYVDFDKDVFPFEF